MSKKQWILTAAVVTVLVTALCIFYFPRKAERVLDLSDKEIMSVFVTTTKGMDDPQRYTTADKGEIAAALECLQKLRLRYCNTSSIYRYRSGEDARVVLRYADGEEVVFTFAVSGEVRRERKNYQAIDNAPLEELMAQIKSWKDSGVIPVSIYCQLDFGGNDPQDIWMRDTGEITAAMALLKKLRAHPDDAGVVPPYAGEYNVKVTLIYPDWTTEFLHFGESGRIRWNAKNYMAEDPAVTKELVEMVRSRAITE